MCPCVLSNKFGTSFCKINDFPFIDPFPEHCRLTNCYIHLARKEDRLEGGYVAFIHDIESLSSHRNLFHKYSLDISSSSN